MCAKNNLRFKLICENMYAREDTKQNYYFGWTINDLLGPRAENSC